MKTYIFLALCLMGIYMPSSATVFTVSNNQVSPTPFTTISSAVAAASAGDTIYILGSPTVYDAFTVSKRLVFFGPGFSPDRAGDKLTATVPSITLSSAASGTEIHGLVINGNITAQANLSNVSIIRNKIAGSIGHSISTSYTYTTWVISNNFFGSSILNAATSTSYHINVLNTLVENNVVKSTGAVMNNVQGDKVFQLKNNVFITSSSAAFTNCKNVILNNNIFINFTSSGLPSDSYAQHNLAYRSGTTLSASFFPTGNALTRDNLINQDPLFATLNPSLATETDDYTLQQNSPAINDDQDWKQMGVFGGNPASNWTYASMPRLPYIHTFRLETTTVPVGGALKLTIISKKQN